MADLHQDGAGAGADFDLSQFYQIFFEEAAENLDQMEQMLLNLDLSAANDEELNGIFRCAHSIKGGAATFGFADVTELTHRMESLLDRLRRHEITPIPEMVDVLLESADASRSLLARHQAGNEGEALSTTDLVARIETLAEGRSAVPAAAVPAPAPTPAPAPVAAPVQAPAPVAAAPVSGGAVGTAPSSGGRSLHILIGPLERLEMAEAIKELFRDIPGLGRIEDLACDQPQSRLFDVQTSSTDDDLLDLFAFHVAKEQVRITAGGAPAPRHSRPRLHAQHMALRTQLLDGLGGRSHPGFSCHGLGRHANQHTGSPSRDAGTRPALRRWRPGPSSKKSLRACIGGRLAWRHG